MLLKYKSRYKVIQISLTFFRANSRLQEFEEKSTKSVAPKPAGSSPYSQEPEAKDTCMTNIIIFLRKTFYKI
jgi:hypothetical protein